MDEQNIDQLERELSTPTPEPTDTGAEHTPEPKKEEFRHIPYNRFKEVNDERRAHESRARELEQELTKYKERQDQLDKIKTPDEIDIKDYTDPQEYLKARDAAIKHAAITEVESRFLARQQESIRQQQLQEIHTTFQRNVAESIKVNPEVKEAVQFLDQYAGNVHKAILHELLVDENAGELIYDITTNQDLLNEMFRGNPGDFIRKIHKMSAKIDRSTRSVVSSDEDVPEALDLKDKIGAGIPAQIKGTAKGKKSPEKMSNAEYRKWVQGGRK
jgi:hypothetical protein